MRGPSPRCLPNSVTLTPAASWTTDPSGGRVEVPGDPSAAIVGSLQPASTRDVAPHLREENASYFTFYSRSDPGVMLRDELNCGDRVMKVIGVRDQAGRGAVRAVDLEERR